MEPPKPSEKECSAVGDAFVACVKNCNLFEIEFGDHDRCKALLKTFTTCVQTKWIDSERKR